VLGESYLKGNEMPLWGLAGGQDDYRKVDKAVNRTREGWISRATSLFRQSRIDDSFWLDLEEILVASDVGVNTTSRLLKNLKEQAKIGKIVNTNQLIEMLKREMVSILSIQGFSGVKTISFDALPKPFVLLVVGVNGVGKTTSIAKLANRIVAQGRSVMLGAGDTFRAGGVEQLRVWADRIGIEMISHNQGSDPGGVAFDAVSAALARGVDFLILDTAGRLHTKHNLMGELDKIGRVIGRLLDGAPHEVLLVLDANTGQNGLAQAKGFAQTVGSTGVFLTKMDGTSKGGVILAISGELGLPIHFIGTGEEIHDMALFDPEQFVEALLGTPRSHLS
jgi:fused signal recognition particle receptor